MSVAVYPDQYAVDVGLRDGSIVHVRPVRPTDESDLATFFRALSERSRWFRFFSAGVNIESHARHAVDLDYGDNFGLVALDRDDEIVGHAQYNRADAERAEVAFAVADAFGGRGLATVLLAHLAARAREQGIPGLVAEVLRDNRRMLGVFRASGLPVVSDTRDGELMLEMPTSLSPETLDRFDARERTAAVAAITTVLAPKTVALVGASGQRGTVGGELLHNLYTAGFTGTIYPVTPEVEAVRGVATYPSLDAVPAEIDLAVVALPAYAVVEAARACARKGVHSLVVVSAGFGETGQEGARMQAELLAACRKGGMRLVGPNCLGVINTDPAVGLDATFSPVSPPGGRIACLSRSGGLGLAIVEQARARGIGLSAFVSVGNKADLSANDFLQYWDQDPATDLVLLYLESFGNPRRFARIARTVGRRKPVLVVKSGRSRAGAKDSSSHTGALVAASDRTVDALFHQAGVIRTDTLTEMFDAARLLATQPLPRGTRVGIVTNARGPGIMCADDCQSAELDVPALSSATQQALAPALSTEASPSNPLDIGASASAEDYGHVLEAVAASGEVDAVVAIFIAPLATRGADVQRVIEAVALRHEALPFLAVLMSDRAHAGPDGRVPTFAFPEEATRALAHATRYRAWRDRPAGSVPELADVRPEEAALLLGEATADGPRWLSPSELGSLLGCYGLPWAQTREAADPDEVARIAAELGGRVVVKAIAPGLVHKSDVGGVRTNVRGADDARAAAEGIAVAVAAAGHLALSFLVQRMADPGVEMLVGVVVEETFGPVVACGAGGTEAALRHDVAVGLAPVTAPEAAEMVRSLALFPLLEGYHGSPPTDVAALEDIVIRVAALADTHPEICELDCNPVVVGPGGAVIVDARVRVAPRPPVKPWPALRGSPAEEGGARPQRSVHGS